MSCRHINDNATSLLDMPSGCTLRVEELTGSPSMRSRLYALGILPGTEMEVCGRACAKGAVCVRVRQSSLVLGEGMARSISCCETDAGGPGRRRRRRGWGWRGSA